MSVRNAVAGDRASGRPNVGRYAYRGAVPLAADPVRLRPRGAGNGVERTATRCLEILAELGGEASAAEIRQRLEADGTSVPRNRVSEALNALARRDPPEAVREGTRYPGRGRSCRWRLAGREPAGRPDDGPLPWGQSRSIARNARRLRLEAGLRQADVAKAAGIAQSTVSNIERGAVRITAGQARAMARAFGVTAEALAGDAA